MTELYLKQAVTNEELVLLINEICRKKCYYSWIFVVAYYSCLHYLYAFLSANGKKIPEQHVDRVLKDGTIIKGAVTIGKENFFTTKNGITTSSGPEFGQLFEWSTIARYRPEKHYLLEDETLVDKALSIIKNSKIIAFNEAGMFCEPSPKKARITCAKIDSNRMKILSDLVEEIKQQDMSH